MSSFKAAANRDLPFLGLRAVLVGGGRHGDSEEGTLLVLMIMCLQHHRNTTRFVHRVKRSLSLRSYS